MIFDLVRENRSTLRSLSVELLGQQSVSSLHSLQSSLTQCSLSEPAKSQSFWSSVQQCERLESLDLFEFTLDSFPADLWNVLCETPLKHLGFHGSLNNSDNRQKFIEVLSCDNLRRNLERLTLDSIYIFHLLFDRLAGQMISPHLSSAFMNVKKLDFKFVAFCCQQTPINWSVFWTVFPALNEINDKHWYRFIFFMNAPDIFSQNVISFCKTYLGVSTTQSRAMKIEIGPISFNLLYAETVMTALVTAATLPDDQEWCVSHGVHIETETRDDKVEKVTLRKDTSTLAFDLIYTNE